MNQPTSLLAHWCAIFLGHLDIDIEIQISISERSSSWAINYIPPVLLGTFLPFQGLFGKTKSALSMNTDNAGAHLNPPCRASVKGSKMLQRASENLIFFCI